MAFRAALAFAAALVLAEMQGLEGSFIAGLVAAALAVGRPLPLPLLVALPIVMWGILAATGIAVRAFAEVPLVLFPVLFAAFYVGFSLCARRQFQSLGLVVLASFAVLPDLLVAAPELARDMARWGAANAAIGCLAAFAAAVIVPRSEIPASDDDTLTAPIPPLSAAMALGCAVLLVMVFNPPGPNAVLIGVILALRADSAPPVLVIRNRVKAAVVGGAAALAIWQIIGLAQSPFVLATSVLFVAWLIVRGRMIDVAERDFARKTLNVLAVLLGKGMSFYLDGADVLLWPRLAGVALGLGYALVILSIFWKRPHTRPALEL